MNTELSRFSSFFLIMKTVKAKKMHFCRCIKDTIGMLTKSPVSYSILLLQVTVFPNCDPETEQMGTILSTNDSTLTLISNIGFSPEVDDTLYFDEDLVLPDDFAKEYGFSSITIIEGLYSVNHSNDESTCVVDVVLVE